MTTTDPTPHGAGAPTDTGTAAAGDVRVHWEARGSGGVPLVLVHGGFGVATDFAASWDAWAARRRVVALELQGHGHTADVAQPFSWSAFGDQIAAVVREAAGGRADVLGFSVGGTAALAAALDHPDLVRRLVLVSVPCRRDGWYPEVLQGMAQIGSAGFEQFRHTPLYAAYTAVAPDPDAFPVLMDKVGNLLREPYDWTDRLAGLQPDTLLVHGDADSIPLSHLAEFFARLGGGLREAGWDGSGASRHRVAVLPGQSHYTIQGCAALRAVVEQQLNR